MASVGGCSASTWVGGFRIGSCINDQDTGVSAFPDAYVDFVPSTANCQIQIQLWDDHNRQYSNQTVSCLPGHYGGAPARVTSATNLHAYARVDLGGSRFAVGDSPAVRLAQGVTGGQGGCHSPDYKVQGFTIGVCVNDRHTGDTAYPDIYVNASPLSGCSMHVQTWDDNNNRLSNVDFPCMPPGNTAHLVGASVTRIPSTVRVHTFARIDVANGAYGVDSPTITIGAYAPIGGDSASARWRAHVNPHDPADQGDPITLVLSRSSTVGMPALINALNALPGTMYGFNTYKWTQVFGTSNPSDQSGWPAGECIHWLQANVQSSGGSYVNQQSAQGRAGVTRAP